MKKIISVVALSFFVFALAGCDLIREEIERAESIELEDFAVNIPERSILLKITSDADEQVIEDVVVNGTEYELESQGDDWYLLSDVPIERSYDVSTVYYRTGVGVRLSFDIDYSIDTNEAVDLIPERYVSVMDERLEKDGYVFTSSDDALINIDSETDFTVEEVDEWVWLILEDEEPVFAVFEHDEEIYVVSAPEDVDEFLDE